MEQEWIPTSERLPELYNDVLFYDGYGIGFGYLNKKGEWLSQGQPVGKPPVTHWTRLPKPPAQAIEEDADEPESWVSKHDY